MIRVLIVEDERPAVAKLRAALGAGAHEVAVVGVCDSVRSGAAWLAVNPAPDLILADIQLGDGTSFQLFAEVPVRCPVVYVTAYDAYWLDAFAANGIDYLLKPVQADQVAAALDKYRGLQAHFAGAPPAAVPEPARAYRQRLVVRRGLDQLSLTVDQAAWLTSEDKLSFVVDRLGHRYLVDQPLAELEAVLDPARFFRLNRRFLAHIDAVARFRSAGRGKLAVRLTPDAEAEVVVSQERAGAFRAWIAG
ncbi:MAG: LytTR family DNA-binding domain-containing protein [Myxococcota bacterium]